MPDKGSRYNYISKECVTVNRPPNPLIIIVLTFEQQLRLDIYITRSENACPYVGCPACHVH
jgi:hypothetical protein